MFNFKIIYDITFYKIVFLGGTNNEENHKIYFTIYYSSYNITI